MTWLTTALRLIATLEHASYQQTIVDSPSLPTALADHPHRTMLRALAARLASAAVNMGIVEILRPIVARVHSQG